MILLEDGLLGPWPIVQVIFKSYLPSKKINLFQTTAQHFFWALQELTNPTPLIFTQILLLHQRGAWISMMIRKLVKMGWLWMDFIKTTTQQYKLSQKKEIVMNCSYLSLMTMMTLMEWTSLIPLQVMKDSRLRCIYMTNCPVWKVMHQSIPSAPSPPPQATEGHLSALSVLEVGHEQILRCPRVGHLPSLGPPRSFWYAHGFLSENINRGFYWKHKQIGSSGWEKLVEGCKGILLILCMHFFIGFQAKITSRNRELSMWITFFCIE